MNSIDYSGKKVRYKNLPLKMSTSCKQNDNKSNCYYLHNIQWNTILKAKEMKMRKPSTLKMIDMFSHANNMPRFVP